MKYSSMKFRMYDKMAPGAIAWVAVAVHIWKVMLSIGPLGFIGVSYGWYFRS
jgi:uncharacterized membrane protein